MHEKHDDHADKKCQRRQRGDSKNDKLRRFARYRSLPERRGVAKTRRRSARLGRLGFYRFQFRQRLRAANIGFEPGFDRAESDSVLETQGSVGYRDAVYFGAVGRFEIFEAISFANEF